MRTAENILVGIHVHSRPADLAATLNALRWNTRCAFQVLLLVDGSDGSIQSASLPQAGIARSETKDARGAPACFNRLVTWAEADRYVFLESGSIVGPGWWSHIENALDAKSTHGLGGPSTNRAWNEQCAFAATDSTYDTVLRNASVAARKFGSSWQKLKPLHSLADFCYVVKREVVCTIGAADEGFGLGPCWEMDYNIRAARAGFDGVWARGSYVHRLPATELRNARESELFAQSRMRYQDKFCALRLDGTREGYEAHCKGDACEHFAPAARIKMREPLDVVPGAAPVQAASLPVASCVMVTSGRLEFLRQAIRYFQRQNFHSKELVIIDDGPEDLSAEFGGRFIRYHHLDSPASIGAKRNIGCERARGEFIVQWDDDDWYSEHRLAYQLAPLLHGDADISALRVEAFFDLTSWCFWRCSPEVHSRMFVEDVQGGTLTFRRELWQRGLRYPDASLAEDADFLKLALRSGARLERMESNGNYIYLRHGSNAWSFVCGEAVDPNGWTQIREPPLAESDRSFYSSVVQQRRHMWRQQRGSRHAARQVS